MIEHRHTLYAGSNLIGQYTERRGTISNEAVYYFHRDHLGSIAVISDEAGAPVERHSHDAFGLRRNPDGLDDPAGTLTSAITRIGYTGHEQLDNVRLIDMNARVYDPVVGRFLSADPTIPRPFDTQSHNRYSYAVNNPLSRVDPTGLADYCAPPFKVYCQDGSNPNPVTERQSSNPLKPPELIRGHLEDWANNSDSSIEALLAELFGTTVRLSIMDEQGNHLYISPLGHSRVGAEKALPLLGYLLIQGTIAAGRWAIPHVLRAIPAMFRAARDGIILAEIGYLLDRLVQDGNLQNTQDVGLMLSVANGGFWGALTGIPGLARPVWWAFTASGTGYQAFINNTYHYGPGGKERPNRVGGGGGNSWDLYQCRSNAYIEVQRIPGGRVCEVGGSCRIVPVEYDYRVHGDLC